MVNKAYDSLVDGELFVLRWREPNAEAAREIVVALERQHEKVGAPIVFAIVVGPDCRTIDKDTRELLLAHHDLIYDLTRAVRLVILPGSIRQSIIRSAVTAMVLVAGMRGQPFAVDKTVEDLIRAIAQTLGRDPEQLRSLIAASGILYTPDARD